MINGVVIISSYAASLKNVVMLLVFWTMEA
jgi:hypothetical protein